MRADWIESWGGDVENTAQYARPILLLQVYTSKEHFIAAYAPQIVA